MAEKINISIIEKAMNMYQEEKISVNECAKRNNIGATTLTRYLIKNNIKIRKYVTRKYNYDETFFEKIDTEEKAYWLGFIAADGSIISNETILEIGLAKKDEQHLEKFIKSIKGSKEMIKQKKQNAGKGKLYDAVRVSVCSAKMCKDLKKQNITPNKSLTLGFLNHIDKNLIKHYLRGYFDGDGSISTNGKNRNGKKNGR